MLKRTLTCFALACSPVLGLADDPKLICDGEDLVTTEDPICKLERILTGEKTVCYEGDAADAAIIGKFALKAKKNIDSEWVVTEDGIAVTTANGDNLLVLPCTAAEE